MTDIVRKSFKGIDKKLICKGVVQISRDAVSGDVSEDIASWYHDTFIPWIRNRIAMYLADAYPSEEYFSMSPPIDLGFVNHYVCLDEHEDTIYFTLLHDAEMFIKTLEVSGAAAQTSAAASPIPKAKPDLVITKCIDMQGVLLNKRQLDSEDVSTLLKFLGFETFGSIKFILKQWNSILDSDQGSFFLLSDQPFVEFYAFIHPNKDSIAENTSPTLDAVEDTSTMKRYIYKSKLTRQTLYAFNTNILLLHEFEKLSDFWFQNPLICSIANSISGKLEITEEAFEEGRQLLDALKTNLINTSGIS